MEFRVGFADGPEHCAFGFRQELEHRRKSREDAASVGLVDSKDASPNLR